MKRILILIALLLMLAVPVMAQDATAAEVAQTEATAWRGLFLMAIALFFAVFGVVIWMAKKLSEAGDKRADAFLSGVERGVKWIPTDEAAKYVSEFRTDAAKTSTPADDVVGMIAAAGVDVVAEFKRFLMTRDAQPEPIPPAQPAG